MYSYSYLFIVLDFFTTRLFIVGTMDSAMQFLTGKLLRGHHPVVSSSSYRDVIFDQSAATLRLVPGEELLLTV